MNVKYSYEELGLKLSWISAACCAPVQHVHQLTVMSQRVIPRLTESEDRQVERQDHGEVAVWSCCWVECTRLGGRLLHIRQGLIDGGSWQRNKKGNKCFTCCALTSFTITVLALACVSLIYRTSASSQHKPCVTHFSWNVLISWLHIISSAWLTHFLFAPNTSLTQHSDHIINFITLRSQSTYELRFQFVGIKDGNVMISHLQRWLWGCIRGSRACSGSTAWRWTAPPWYRAAREDTCHQTTGTAYWTRNNVCIWKSKCTQIIMLYIIIHLHMV